MMSLRISEHSIVYRGEGNSSLIVSLRDCHQVLRILKFFPNEIPSLSFIQRTHEDQIRFTSRILRKLIDPLFYSEQILVLIKKDDIELINQVSKSLRPLNRLGKIIPNEDTWALLSDDHCFFPQELHFGLVGPVICIEIKPKQGFLPATTHLDFNMRIKSTVCRFALRQAYKIQTKLVQRESKYCPLDLFSGCKARMKRAISSLFDNPQNNLRIFKDGERIYGDDKIGDLSQVLEFPNVRCGSRETIELLTDLIIKGLLYPISTYEPDKAPLGSPNCEYHYPSGNDCSSRDCNLRSGSVLYTILKLQLMDDLETSLAFQIFSSLQSYYDFDNFISLMEKRFDRYNRDNFYGFIRSPKMSNETQDEFHMRKLWAFLISIMAKDCSIMITLQRTNSGQKYPHVIKDLSGLEYSLRISITDLIRKPFTKIRDAFENDIKMILAFNEMK